MPFPSFLMPLMELSLAAEVSPGPLGGESAKASRLSLSVTPQEQTCWCWAAVSTSISRFYSPDSEWTQCMLAGAALSRTDCCDAGAADPDRCNKPWCLNHALNITGNLDRMESRPLTFEEVQIEIARGAPLGTRVRWDGGGGHFQVIVGWLVTSNGIEYIDVSDPVHLDTRIAFQRFALFYQFGGKWTHSYVTKRPDSLATSGTAGGTAGLLATHDQNALGA